MPKCLIILRIYSAIPLSHRSLPRCAECSAHISVCMRVSPRMCAANQHMCAIICPADVRANAHTNTYALTHSLARTRMHARTHSYTTVGWIRQMRLHATARHQPRPAQQHAQQHNPLGASAATASQQPASSQPSPPLDSSRCAAAARVCDAHTGSADAAYTNKQNALSTRSRTRRIFVRTEFRACVRACARVSRSSGPHRARPDNTHWSGPRLGRVCVRRPWFVERASNQQPSRVAVVVVAVTLPGGDLYRNIETFDGGSYTLSA